MNFFDTFEVARSTTPTTQTDNSQNGTGTSSTPQQQTPEPTLNDEINQVVGQLGRLWGGFRKQSQIAIETARKDFGSVVVQAQRELGKLTAEPTASTSSTTPSTSSQPTTGPNNKPDTEEKSTEGDSNLSSTPDKVEDERPRDTTSPSAPPTETPASPFQSFFSRIQASVPPNIATTIQANIPESIRNSTNTLPADFAQLRSTISSELQRVQGITRAQAEEYVHKSEALFKEAGEFLKDAVKIVPPEETDGRDTAVMWDGSDVWLIPSMVSSRAGELENGSGDSKGKARQVPTYSRSEALLQRLKRDPEVIKVDPTSVEQTKDLFDKWHREHVLAKEGGMDHLEWFERIKATLNEKGEGEVLTKTRDSLVPSIMDSQTFWTRYFFRVYQIEKDEEKRKALLEAQATESEEDFNWEDEDEDDSTTPPIASSGIIPGKLKEETQETPTSTKHVPRASSDTIVKAPGQLNQTSTTTSLVSTPSNTSPRESSECSYDLVSAGSAQASTGAKSPVKEVEEDDSDWE